MLKGCRYFIYLRENIVIEGGWFCHLFLMNIRCIQPRWIKVFNLSIIIHHIRWIGTLRPLLILLLSKFLASLLYCVLEYVFILFLVMIDCTKIRWIKEIIHIFIFHNVRRIKLRPLLILLQFKVLLSLLWCVLKYIFIPLFMIFSCTKVRWIVEIILIIIF